MINNKMLIVEPIGIHAKVAANIVNVASNYKSDITMIHDGREANLKSILNILALGIANDETVEIIYDGEDENEAIIGMESYLVSNNIAKVIYK